MGSRTERTYSVESTDTKQFIEFVALIIRNRLYTILKDEMDRLDKRVNYITVPAALKELDKLEILKRYDGEYTQDHAVTATQKAILKAFGMDSAKIKQQVRDICREMTEIDKKSAGERNVSVQEKSFDG